MRLLIVGSGAREHALAWKCARSPLTERLYVAPGNGGTPAVARNVQVSADEPAKLVKLARKEKLDLVVLGPESAVAAGVGDALRHAGVPVFGPSKEPGRIETSKAFAKELMGSAGIPTAAHEVFTEAAPAKRWARARKGQVAVKADGLALGKGVLVCSSMAQAEAAIDAMLVQRTFGRAGSTVVLEERIEGPEISVFGVTDGERVVPLAAARDFKRAREGDEGPNTGGMGAYSPPSGITAGMVEEIVDMVMRPAVRELARRGLEYRGVLFAGLMLTAHGPRVIEFNARFGDPETQVLMPRLSSDLVPLMLAAALGELPDQPRVEWDPRPTVGIVVASGGYPETYETGFPIEGLTSVPHGVLLFHAGTRLVPDGSLLTSGGRVLTSVAMGANVEQARMGALSGAVRVRFAGAYYRRDIGQEAVRVG
ncbi:MAG: phosphoribosylamine--glycine ligase [Candidatus Dormibacteraeota bacterium]|nr:phosphoribosylamine--glycine ligase [Candidatus Dormibacteraeota bacterium]